MGHVHPGREQPAKHFRRVGRWAEGRYYACDMRKARERNKLWWLWLRPGIAHRSLP